MTSENPTAAGSKAGAWVGRVLSALCVLFFVFDGTAKLFKPPPVREASAELGIPEAAIAGIGVVLLACTALYAIPATSVLGAILLTGYLGGAVAIHVRVGGPPVALAFSTGFGVLAWLGLYLREPRLRALIPVRRPPACEKKSAL